MSKQEESLQEQQDNKNVNMMEKRNVSGRHGGGAPLRSETTKIIMKSDREATNKTVRDESARRLGGRVAQEQPAKKVRSPAMGQLKKLENSEIIRLGFSQTIGRKDEMRTQSWKPDYTVADPVGSNVCGKTAYGRRRGRACKIPDTCFGHTRKVRTEIHLLVSGKVAHGWCMPPAQMRYLLARKME